MASKTYVRDRRSTSNNSITLNANVQGYSYTPSWTVSNGTLSASTGTTVTLTIPYYNTYDTVEITMKYSTNPTFSMKISVVDITEYGHSYGLLSSAPSSNPTPIYVSGKPTDYYTNSTDGITYEYNGSWVACSDASKLTKGLKLLLDNDIDISSLSDANTVSFFRSIITQTIYTEAIKAVNGFFDSIHVSGNSQFDGQIINDAIHTYPAVTGRTIDLSPHVSYSVGPIKTGTITRNDCYHSTGYNSSDLNEELGNYGTYISNSGSITVYASSSSSSAVVYTASSGSPITITYTATKFSIVQGATVILDMDKPPIHKSSFPSS